MDLGLRNKRALIIGAGSDVGRATAMLLAEEGARLMLAGRSADALARTAAGVADAAAGTAECITADTREPTGAAAALQAALDRLGGIDILVNTVGPFPRFDEPLPAYGSDESWLQVFDTVFMTAVRICRAVIPVMKQAGSGSVINLAANSARYYHPNTAQYGAMKSALTHVTKNWARDAIGSGVRVNAVLPGWIKTDAAMAAIAERAVREQRTPAQIEQAMVSAHDALFWSPRMGTPLDYANAIVFLASDRAGYVNGALVPVDGGSPVW